MSRTESDTRFGDQLRQVSEDVRSGPVGEMRALTKLSRADLLRGAVRDEQSARARRALADKLDSEGRKFAYPYELRQILAGARR